MKLFFRVFVSFCFFFLLLFSGGKALALQTAEIFATSTSVSAWDSFSNLLGPPNSIYATKTTGTLGGYWYFSDSLNIPISATITSLVFKIYAQSSGNSSGMNGWSVYLSGVSCSSFPNISLGNGIRTVTVDATNCTGTNDFVDVVQAHKLTLNMSSLHVIGYPRSGISDRIYIWDSVGVYATYELPAPIPTPTPSNIDLTPGSVWEWPTATISATQKGGLVDVISVSAGQDHSLALTSDGVVWAWGSNSNGQLGNGAVGGFTAEPVRVKSPDGQGYLADIKAIAAGTKYSLALKNDGTVWTWGYNGYGARGTGLGVGYPYEEYRNLPLATQVQTSGGFSQIIAIAAGGYHSLALKSDGSVFTWGNNAQGQTGTGYSIYSSIVSSPKKVLNNVTSIAGGIYHSIVSKNDGTVWGSGRISAGQLGSVTNSWASGVGLPVQIPEIGGIKSVWAKGSASMALAEDNTVYEWGSGRWLPYDANPRQIPGLDDVRMISSGSYFTGYIGIALKSDGTVWMFDVQTLIAQQVPGFSNIGFVSGGSGGVPNLAVVKMSEPTPTPSPSPTPTPKTPLILIPGIAGSEFKSSETFLSPIKDCGTEPVFMYDTNLSG